MEAVTLIALTVAGGAALAYFGRRILLRTPELGQALVISRAGNERPRVAFERTLVRPLLDHAEMIDLTTRAVVVDRLERGGLLTSDGLRVDVRVEIAVQVGRSTEDIVQVAERVGCAKATDPETLSALFQSEFFAAVRDAVVNLSYEEATNSPELLEDAIAHALARDLGGYIVVNVQICSFELTPADRLDQTDLVDALALAKLRARGHRS